MGVDLDSFSELVRERLRESGETAAGAALRAGLPRDAIRSVLRGHPPTFIRAAEICEALGCEFYMGPPRGEKTERKVHSPRWADRFRSDLRTGFRVDMGKLLQEQRTKMAGDVREWLDEANAARTRAEGADPSKWAALRTLILTDDARNLIREGMSFVAFHKDWLARRGMSDNCVVLLVSRDAMDPIPPYDSMLLLDRGRRKPQAGRLYMLLVDDGPLRLRRAVWAEDRWMIATNSPGQPLEPWPPEAEVMGEARHLAHTVEDLFSTGT